MPLPHRSSSCCALLLLYVALSGQDSVPTTAPRVGFDIDTANATLNLAWAAYCNQSALDSWSCEWCDAANRLTLLQYMRTPDSGTQGYVALDARRKTIVVAIRGSVNLMNYVQDAMIWQTEFGPAPTDVKVHSGFAAAYESLRANILLGVTEGKKRCPKCTILLTGHSLGAAVATLAGVDLASRSLPKTSVRLFTFGSPRVGNKAFAQWAMGLVDESSFRMAREDDMVPGLPPRELGYEHIPTEVWDRHHPEQGDWYIVCDISGEDPKCYNSQLNLDPSQHIRYMGFKGGSCIGGHRDMRSEVAQPPVVLV